MRKRQVNDVKVWARTRQAFTDWIEERSREGQRLLAEDLATAPRRYFEDGSSTRATEFFNIVDRWRRWTSGLVTGLRRRVDHADHLVADATERFAESKLLVFQIADHNNPQLAKTFDLRNRAAFTDGSGWLDLHQWSTRGREVPLWDVVRHTLSTEMRAFTSMINEQFNDLVLIDLEAGEPTYGIASDSPEPEGARYACSESLGEGVYGEAWRAEDKELKREVAVKFIRSTGASRKEAVEHARAIARVTDPSIVAVYDVARVFDPVTKTVLDAVVMELVEGQSLVDRLGRAVDRADASRIGGAVLDAVTAYHSVGLVHLDLHDGNVIVGDRFVKIIDPMYFETIALKSSGMRETHQQREVRRARDILVDVLRASDVPLDVAARFEHAVAKPQIELLRASFRAALEHPATADRPTGPPTPEQRGGASSPRANGPAVSTPALPDVRVVVTPGFAQAGSTLTDLLIITVENHSLNPFFLSTIALKTADGNKGVFVQDDATGRANASTTVMPGDSHSLHLAAERIRLVANRGRGARFISAVVTDKIGRRFESDPRSFAEVLATLKLA